MTEIVEMRGEGLETVGWSERGWGVVALPFQRVHLVYSKTNYTVTKTQQNKPSPRNPAFDSWGTGYINTDKPFPWHPSRSTRGQTTNMTDKSSHGTHFKVNHETDYTTHKAFPWHSSQSIQGDRLHRDGQNLPLESF